MVGVPKLIAVVKFVALFDQEPVLVMVLSEVFDTPDHCAFVGTLNPVGQGSLAVLDPSVQAPLAAAVVFQPEIDPDAVLAVATTVLLPHW
jgi:hypothetical protein